MKLVRELGLFCLERLSRTPRVGLIVLRIWRRGQSTLPSPMPLIRWYRYLWEGADIRLSSLGYEAGSRILSLLLLRNTQASGTKVCISLAFQPAPWLSVISPSRDQDYQADIQEPKREHRLIPALQFVHTQVYKYIFGKPADGLERSVEGEDECESPSIVFSPSQCRSEWNPDRSRAVYERRKRTDKQTC